MPLSSIGHGLKNLFTPEAPAEDPTVKIRVIVNKGIFYGPHSRCYAVGESFDCREDFAQIHFSRCEAVYADPKKHTPTPEEVRWAKLNEAGPLDPTDPRRIAHEIAELKARAEATPSVASTRK
jgi:hypothetical protein